MIEFTLWDIVRNLLLALRWTVALSAIAFIGGGFVGGWRCGCALAPACGAPSLFTCSCSRARRC
jgi:hypothetical protein